jgi:hypothetical protein
MSADLVYLVAGVSLLLAVVLPALLDRCASDVSRRRTRLRVVKHTLDVVTRVTLLFRIA